MSFDDLTSRETAALGKEILPALTLNATRMELVGIEAGIVQIRLSGTSPGCPLSTRAILMGIEDELRERFAEIDYLEVLP